MVRRLVLAGGTIFLVWIAVYSLWWLWHDVTYAKAIEGVFKGPLEYVEFQPNTDWPRRQVTDRATIEALEKWLHATSHDDVLRSDPPACVCELRLVFRDGREEIIAHSPFRHALTPEGHQDSYRDVRVEFQGHLRSGDRDLLANILDPK